MKKRILHGLHHPIRCAFRAKICRKIQPHLRLSIFPHIAAMLHIHFSSKQKLHLLSNSEDAVQSGDKYTSPRNTKPSFSTCPRCIFQTSKAGLLADCVEQCSCGCAFSSFRSMTSASASQNTVMAVAPDSNRLPFSPERILRAPCMCIELWPYYSAMDSIRQLSSPVYKRKDEEPNWSSPWDMGFLSS